MLPAAVVCQLLPSAYRVGPGDGGHAGVAIAQLAVHDLGDAAGQRHTHRGQVEALDVSRPQGDRVPQFLHAAGVLHNREQRVPIAAARAAGGGEFNFVTEVFWTR